MVEVRTFVVDGTPYGVVWIDHGYRSGPRATHAHALGAIPFVPEAALDETASRLRAAEQRVEELGAALRKIVGCYGGYCQQDRMREIARDALTTQPQEKGSSDA